MAIKLVVHDTTSNVIDRAIVLSNGVALQMLSKSGSVLADRARGVMHRGKTSWFSKDGRIWKDNAKTKELGRFNNKDHTMASMIGFYLDERNSLMVVGGRFPTHYPTKRRNGVDKGSMKRVKGVGKDTHAVLHKLNFGSRTTDTGYKHTWRGKDSMDRFKDAVYRKNLFMQKGYVLSRAKISSIMTSEAKSEFGNAMDLSRVSVKIIK